MGTRGRSSHTAWTAWKPAISRTLPLSQATTSSSAFTASVPPCVWRVALPDCAHRLDSASGGSSLPSFLFALSDCAGGAGGRASSSILCDRTAYVLEQLCVYIRAVLSASYRST